MARQPTAAFFALLAFATVGSAVKLQYNTTVGAHEWAAPFSWSATVNGTASRPYTSLPCSGDAVSITGPSASVTVFGRARCGTVLLDAGELVIAAGARLDVFPDADDRNDDTLCSVNTTVATLPVRVGNVTDAASKVLYQYDDAVTFQVLRNAFSDANGEVLKFSVGSVTINGQPPPPARSPWWSFDARSLVFSGVPHAGEPLGLYTVRINAANSVGSVFGDFSFLLYRVVACPCKNNGACTAFNADCNCKAALPGFTGPTCEDACAISSFTWGPNCETNCACSRAGSDRCVASTGDCVCKAGWENGADGPTCGQSKAPLFSLVALVFLRATQANFLVDVTENYGHAIRRVEGVAASLGADHANANAVQTWTLFQSRASGGQYIVSFAELNANAAYNITMWAVNAYNRTSASVSQAVVTLAVTQPPAPTILSMSATHSLVSLVFNASDENGKVKSFMVVRDPGRTVQTLDVKVTVGNQGLVRLSPTGMTFAFNDSLSIQGSTTYSYTLYARNAGVDGGDLTSNASETRSITTPAAPQAPITYTPTSGSGGSSIVGPVVGVLFGVGGAAGLAFGVVWYVRRNKKREAAAVAQTELALIETVSTRPEIAQLEIHESLLKLLSKLGEGEFGMVHKGLATIDDEKVEVAVKTLKINVNLPADETLSLRSAFMGEIDLMRSVPPHPNVVAMLAVITLSTPNRIVLEFCDLGDLRTYLLKNSESLDDRQLLHFARDGASGMAHLEQLKIVHRDLAGRNCMLKSGAAGRPVLKIGDFGLSRSVSDNDYYRVRTRGKLPVKWMAPESLEKRIFTHASDVWSFGVVMWEMWSRGAKPYPGLENHRVMEHIRSGKRLEAPENCPPAIHKIMEQCWKKHPETRPKFADLVRSLAALASSGEDWRGSAALPDAPHAENYAEIDIATNPTYGYAEG